MPHHIKIMYGVWWNEILTDIAPILMLSLEWIKIKSSPWNRHFPFQSKWKGFFLKSSTVKDYVIIHVKHMIIKI